MQITSMRFVSPITRASTLKAVRPNIAHFSKHMTGSISELTVSTASTFSALFDIQYGLSSAYSMVVCFYYCCVDTCEVTGPNYYFVVNHTRFILSALFSCLLSVHALG